jgi:hypothetical protein
MQRLMSVLLVVVAACGGNDGGSSSFPDAWSGQSDGAAASDSAPAQGLVVDWRDMPTLPGMVSSTVTVFSVKLHVKKLEVVSDGGSVPDTTDDDFDLAWVGSSRPFPISFPTAPPAVYSKVRINLDKGSSNTPSVEITGSTTASGSAELFTIRSEQKLDLELSYQQFTLLVGDSKTVRVRVALDEGLENIDWVNLRKPSTMRLLDDTDTQAMDAFFDDLEEVFSASVE